MNYLLDTCVLSELIKRPPHPGVANWIQQATEADLYLSVVTIGEIKKGIDKLPPSRRKDDLSNWLARDLLARFRGRLLAIDQEVALAWGALAARQDLAGRRMPAIDALIAATALNGNLTLVTRNVPDFANSGVTVVNPWD